MKQPTMQQRKQKAKQWEATKKRYWASKMPKNCHICDAPKHKGIHLHHLTYERYGKERLNDIVPVCRKCHGFIHSIYEERVNGVRKYSLWEATDKARFFMLV